MRLISTFSNVNPGIFRAITWNVDGEYCLTADSQRVVSLWNPYPTASDSEQDCLIKPLAQYQGHNREVLTVHANANNSKICSAGQDKAIFCWDVETGRATQRLTYHTGRTQCVRFVASDPNGLISGSLDCHVCIWDLRRSSKPVQILKEARDAVYSVVASDTQHQHNGNFSHLNGLVITGSLDCRIRTYDLRKAILFTDCVGWPVTCVRTDDNEAALVCCQNGPMRLIDLADGQMLGEYKGHTCKSFIVECDFDKSGSRVMAGSEMDGTVKIWDTVTQKEVGELKHNTKSPVITLAAHPTKADRVVTAQNSSIYVWSV